MVMVVLGSCDEDDSFLVNKRNYFIFLVVLDSGVFEGYFLQAFKLFFSSIEIDMIAR